MKSEQCQGGRWIADQRGAFLEPQYLSTVLIERIDRSRAKKLVPPVKVKNENTPGRNQ